MKGVAFAEMGAPLAVAEDHVGHEILAEHGSGHFAGEGAAGLRMHVLGAELHHRTVDRFCGAFQAR